MNHPRIGLGIDVHRMAEGRPCTLGGIPIPHDKGPVGHSDGDAVLHAACDAVLGAAGLDDLGSLFPDDDPAHADRASADFCEEACRQMMGAGFELASMDIVIEAERPKIAPHRSEMRKAIARLFRVTTAQVNVRGKTAEGIGTIGSGDAVRATAVALLVPRTQ